MCLIEHQDMKTLEGWQYSSTNFNLCISCRQMVSFMLLHHYTRERAPTYLLE
jgi:hypothetical protein